MDIIKARVRSLREHKGWSQEDLARESGLKRPHISLIETGERIPGAKTLSKLADALETSLDYLLGRTDSPAVYPSANHPAMRDSRFVYFADRWILLPDYAQDIFIKQIRVMECLNPDLRQAMAERGLELPEPPEE